MSSKEDLIEWVQNVPWGKWIYDKEIGLLLVQLRDRINALSQGASTDNEKTIPSVKLVTVGDGAVGKTSLLISYITDNFPSTYVPTVFENHSKQVKHNATNEDVILRLWDTAGQEDYDRLRPLSYPGADLILICFSTVAPSSLQMVEQKWYPEVKHYAPDVPVILVGTKIDLRDSDDANKQGDSDEEKKYVTTEEGEALRKKIKAVKYIEVSSKTRLNLEDVFQSSMSVVLESRENFGDSSSVKPSSATNNNQAEPPAPRKKSMRIQKMCVLF